MNIDFIQSKIQDSSYTKADPQHLYFGDLDANKLFLKHVDPKLPVYSPVLMRRKFMSSLLTWGDIVISDSQMMVDPRLRLLTSFAQDDKKHPDYNVHGLVEPKEWQVGFEELLRHGYVKQATRDRDGSAISMYRLWTDMSGRKDPTPNLPVRGDYAQFLTETHIESKLFRIEDAAARFRSNLHAGIPYFSKNENFVALDMNPDHKEDQEIIGILEQDSILFATILDKLNSQLKEGRIKKDRFDQIYQYVNSCYCVNVPALTDSYVQMDENCLPLHLDCGTGDYELEPYNADYQRLRKSFALDPAVLDYLSMNEFVGVKEAVQDKYINTELMQKFNVGTLTASDWEIFPDFWADYTLALEAEMRQGLQNERDKTWKALDEMNSVSSQKTLRDNGMEAVFTVIGQAGIPVLGTLLDIIGALDLFKSSYIAFSNRAREAELRDKKAILDGLCGRGTKLITKF